MINELLMALNNFEISIEHASLDAGADLNYRNKKIGNLS